MKHIAIYYRVSTDRQDLDSQKLAVEEYIAKLPMPPESIVVYADHGRSGADDTRKEFLRMLSDAGEKKFDTVLVYKLDRFSRASTTAIREILRLDSLGVQFAAVSQPALCLAGMPFRKMILACFAELAEIERDMIVERTKAGLRAAALKGNFPGRPPIFRNDPAKVAAILEMYEQGLAGTAIATALGLKKSAVYNFILKMRTTDAF